MAKLRAIDDFFVTPSVKISNREVTDLIPELTKNRFLPFSPADLDKGVVQLRTIHKGEVSEYTEQDGTKKMKAYFDKYITVGGKKIQTGITFSVEDYVHHDGTRLWVFEHDDTKGGYLPNIKGKLTKSDTSMLFLARDINKLVSDYGIITYTAAHI
jgi:hypothetical protein